MKATAVAHPIQGLVKYHGLKDIFQRIPFHNSISVCVDALQTTTTVEVDKRLGEEVIVVNGEHVTGRERERIQIVLSKLKTLAGYQGCFKVISQNSVKMGKGLGFSASGFAALGVATCNALNLNLDYITLSEIVRLGAGSATRSLAGGFALWYADKDGHSYAEQLASPEKVDFSMVIVPIHSEIRTEEAHAEVVSSPLFQARLGNIDGLVETMQSAIVKGDTAAIGQLAEEDSLNLHAITMTGKSHLVLWEPDTIRLIRVVDELRSSGVQCWYSIDTGPSVFINTFQNYADAVAEHLIELGLSNVIVSGIGGKPEQISSHLF